MTKRSIKFPDYISWSLLCDEIFVFNELNGKITVLKGASKDLWLFLEKSRDILKVIDYISNKDNISFEKVNEKIRYLMSEKTFLKL